MRRSRFGVLVCFAVLFAGARGAVAQNPDALSPYFEGKQVVVKMDMPGTQKGVDIYPNRQPTLEAKSYGDRMKEFGVSLQNGQRVMVTKVKVNKDNVEFQLGGGGFGTAMDNADTSVHFTPAPKSDRERELEDQLRNETDPNRRRSLQRELDYVRAERDRRDAYERARAEDDAAYRTQQVGIKRQQGGSRFNIRIDARKMGDSLTPQVVMDALAAYIDFSGDAAGSGAGGRPADAAPGAPELAVRSPDQGGDPGQGLKKGMSREQVEAMYGKAVEAHDHTESGLTITSCTFIGKDEKVQADFVNGVLVQYSVSSR
ncbi:MAG TPA: hypothetical protein VNX17_01755 [Edaphobacter sp.]|jgi:hypothetical protein|nr:hypothetical protein [Edaphobacter sp.]